MFRRSILALSHRRLSVRRVPNQASAQKCFRREFSSVPPGPGPTNKPSGAGRNFSKVLVGTAAIGACFIAAYSSGYLDDILGKNKQSSIDMLNGHSDRKSTGKDGAQYPFNVKDPIPEHSDDGSESPAPDSNVKGTNDLIETQAGQLSHGDFSNPTSEEASTQVPVAESMESSNNMDVIGERPSNSSNEGEITKDGIVNSQQSFGDAVDVSSPDAQASTQLPEENEKFSEITDAGAAFQGNNVNEDKPVDISSGVETMDMRSQAPEQSLSLSETYDLRDDASKRESTSSEHGTIHLSPREETSRGASEDLSDAYVSKDGKLILDFLQAIHVAEQRQAELDALVLAEEKRALKDKYEKELKDARARELMYAEEAAMLEKEVKREKARAAAALKSLQERAEERLKMALEEKEREAESKLKEIQDIAKAELAASTAREKAAQIEKMAEANLNINALCMAFYARSEEARQTHSIHKLALGALALEDALSNGLPVQAELDALGVHIEGADKDSLLQLAVSSLPEDVRLHGTDSLLHLNQKFDQLKGTLRHFSLIPPDGAGILSHSLARVASFLKVKEADQSGDGIESLINKVDSLLAQGKLVEAADALEDGVKGSNASEVVTDWLRRARNRAIAEQALVLLQSYATAMSLT